jgi:hypothetical protein
MEEDYPSNELEFAERFATEESCRVYLEQLRWPNGFICPRCLHPVGWRIRRQQFQCAACHYAVSVTAGTILQDTHKPLRLWFRTAWYVTGQKYGASALGLQRVLGLGGYLTAWSWLHKLRRAMVRPGRDTLCGRVEVDETYVGGMTEGKRGRGSENKALVAIAAQEDGDGIGRIRMARIADASAVSLQKFIAASVKSGSVIHTDAWEGYAGLTQLGYRHETTCLSDHAKSSASQLLPRVHRVAALLNALAAGNPSRSRATRSLGLLFGRVCFSI